MKLGTLKSASRDGALVVVNKNHTRYVEVGHIAPNLQTALDNWEDAAPALEKVYSDICANPDSGQPVADAEFAAPLPRAYEWIDGSAYINHVVLVRKARNAEPPETLKTDPLIYQGGSGVLLGHKDDIPLADESWGLDFESEVAVILGDTPQGTTKAEAHKHIRLLAIVNDVSLRNLIPEELKKNFGFFQSKPATAFAPFVITPDELGDSFKDGRIHLPLHTQYNGQFFGDPDAGDAMHFSFYDLIEHIAKSRSYTAGTILGSGTVSNEDRKRGSSCLAEVRMLEKIDSGEMKTPFMKVGDRVQIYMNDKDGNDIFGHINQQVVAYKKP